MKVRVAASVIGAVATAVLAVTPVSAQAAAKPYDHQDPYKSGCGNSARVVKTAAIKSKINGKVGTIKLMWSGRCKTNWIEISTASSVSGSINLYTADGRHDRFAFRKGNGGRHWGNMLWANNMCAWGGAAVQWGGGNGGQYGSGTTGKACR
ncbi:DUF2690 domain-containing protein [Nonomuraea sp. NN258]|uniref:DUF2690 domain-containing protein n=1 Tax=Nonomuraea antri TaxID=2730852 RepID=UPI0015699025|nr:DUF2690 domain-containing protein [Nonomuraea antri]NRQ36170.1 DUF2690 domain-containing protein [Nonomuraea antri]